MSIRWPDFRARAHGALCALGFVLVAAPAAAQLAGGQLANDVCRIESTRVGQLQTALIAAVVASGYSDSLSEAECEKFVKKQVKNCIAIIENGTDCRAALDATEQKIQRAQCKEEETKADRKACERDAVLTQEANDQVGNSNRVVGTNSCNGSFATAMRNLCLGDL